MLHPAIRRGATALAIALGTLAALSFTTQAPVSATTNETAAWPTRPVTIVVTFPPGGGTDLLARKLGDELAQRIGHAVIVENRPGASGSIGARTVVEAPADGHMLLMVNSSYAVSPAVFAELPFSPKEDLRAVVNVAYVPSVLVVPADAPARSLNEWLQADQSGPAPAYASCGNGTPQHLAGEMLARAAGRPLLHVPYRGCGPALQDVAAGQVGAAFVTASSTMPLLASGHLRALAVTSPRRSPLLPDVPTVAEAGFAGYALDQWHGLLVRTGAPDAHIRTLYEHIAAILEKPDMRTELQAMGFEPVLEGPEQFQRVIESDIDRFTALARQIGLRVD